MKVLNVLQSTYAVLMLMKMNVQVRGDFKFEIEFYNYSNPTHTSGQNNGCCDSNIQVPPNCRSHCDTYFVICLRKEILLGVNFPVEQSACPHGFLITNLLVNGNTGDSIEFSTNESLDTSGLIQNPLDFQSDAPWTGFIEVIIQPFDLDNGRDDWIDVHSIVPTNSSLSPLSPTFTPPTKYTGVFGYSQITLSLKVSCVDDYYGIDCTVYCSARDDGLGHYTCAGNGSLICRQGYSDTSTNCTQCVPSDGCSVGGGYCELPGECTCYEGYLGEKCSVSSQAVAGVLVALLLILLVSAIPIAVVVIIVARKRRGRSNNLKIHRAGRTVYQENSSYIDLISKDALTRSSELIMSTAMSKEGRLVLSQGSEKQDGSHESSSTQLDSQTITHKQRERDQTGNAYKLRSRTSDSGEETSNWSQEDESKRPLSQTPSYIASSRPLSQSPASSQTVIENPSSTTSSRPLSQTPSYIASSRSLSQNPSSITSSSAESHDENMSAIPLRKNLSYIMLDIEEEKANDDDASERTDLAYSYTRAIHSSQEDKFPETNLEQTGEAFADTPIYSKVELENMYENVPAGGTMETNMVYNEFYKANEVPEREEGHVYAQ